MNKDQQFLEINNVNVKLNKSIIFNEEEKDFFVISQDIQSQEKNEKKNEQIEIPYQQKYKPRLSKIFDNTNYVSFNPIQKRGSITFDSNSILKLSQQLFKPQQDLKQDQELKPKQINLQNQQDNSIILEHQHNNSQTSNNLSPLNNKQINQVNNFSSKIESSQSIQSPIQLHYQEISQDQILDSAIQILKRRNIDHRSEEELNILMKATEPMNFFQKILQKKSFVENNLHLNLCKAMHFKHLKKGGIVFYEGDSADFFYILLKGEVVILIPKNEQELYKEKRKQEQLYPQPGLPPKLQFKIRKFLFIKNLQRIVKIIINTLRFINFLKQDCIEYRCLRKQEKILQQQKLFQSQVQQQTNNKGSSQSIQSGDSTIQKNSGHKDPNNIFQSKKKTTKLLANPIKEVSSSSFKQNKQEDKLNSENNNIVVDKVNFEKKTMNNFNNLNATKNSIINKIDKNKETEQQQQLTKQQQNYPNQQSDQNQDNVPQLSLVKKIKNKVQKVVHINFFSQQLSYKQSTIQQAQTSIMGPFGAKIYKDIREDLLKQIPKFDIDKISNPAHFFIDNTFKYNIAVVLDQGYVFGELGILNKKPRAGTIVCLEETQFAMLSAQDYEKILMKMEKLKLLKKVRFIAQAMNMNLSIEKMSKISYIFTKKKYNMGDKIYLEGDNPNSVYLLKNGTVELLKTVEVTTEFNEKLKIQARVAQIGANEFFGEDDVYLNRQHMFTAVAVDNICVFEAAQNQFVKNIGENQEMLQILYDRMDAKENRRMCTLNDIIEMRENLINLKNLYYNKSGKQKIRVGQKSLSLQSKISMPQQQQKQDLYFISSNQNSVCTATQHAAELFQKESNQLPTYNKLKMKIQRFKQFSLIDKNTIKTTILQQQLQNELKNANQNNQLNYPLSAKNQNTKKNGQQMFFSHIQPLSIKKIVKHNNKVLLSHTSKQNKISYADLYNMTREIALLNNNQLQKMEVVNNRRNQMEIERIEKKSRGEYTNYNTINYIHSYSDNQLHQLLNQQNKNPSCQNQVQEQIDEMDENELQNTIQNELDNQSKKNKGPQLSQIASESLLQAQNANFYKGTLYSKLKNIEEFSIYDKPDAEMFVSQLSLGERKYDNKSRHYKSCSLFHQTSKNQSIEFMPNNQCKGSPLSIKTNNQGQKTDKTNANSYFNSPKSLDNNNKTQQQFKFNKFNSNIISDNNLKTENDIEINQKIKNSYYDTNIIQTSRYFDKLQQNSSNNIQSDFIFKKDSLKQQSHPSKIFTKLEVVSNFNTPRDQSTEIDFMINGLIINQNSQTQKSKSKSKSKSSLLQVSTDNKFLLKSQQQIPPYIDLDNNNIVSSPFSKQQNQLKIMHKISLHQQNQNQNYSTQLNKQEKIVVINHMLKPITYTARKIDN